MRIFVDLFWQCDVIGILLIIIALGFFLTPFTLAGGTLDPSQTWRQAKIVAPLVVGFVFFPILFFWEKLCSYPLIPFYVSFHFAFFASECVLHISWGWAY